MLSGQAAEDAALENNWWPLKDASRLEWECFTVIGAYIV